MRNYDNWNRYLDNDNKPLHGCIQFMVKDGNTVAPIYDIDGTALDNPQITDIYGRTEHQVFIDVDVIAYFYKYVGQGKWIDQQDIDTSDVSKWSLQYTTENINDILAHITGDAAMCVGTIGDLRNLDINSVPEVCGIKVITLLGYDEPGDKESVNYIWYPSLTDNDDNGAVIQGPNLTGRWVMVKPTEHCDSRHYGIFPRNTTNFTSDTSRIEQWITYCNSVNLRPYFSAKGDYKYYKYNNLSFTIPVVDVAKDVTFLDNGSSNIWSTEFNGDPYFYNHNTKLNSKEVKTSWGAYIYISPKRVIVDDNDLFFNTTLSNCEVDIDVACNQVCNFNNCTVNINKSFNSISAFSNCIINSKNMINSGCHFVNCKLTEDMFYGSPYIHVDGNCIADFDDFEHKELMWLRIKEQQQQINYDWKGRLTQQDPWEGVVDSDRWLINYKGINADAVLKESDNAHTYLLENCAGTITLQGKAANTYRFKNCEMVVKFADGYNENCILIAQDSTINISQERIKLANLNVQNTSLIGTGSFDALYAAIYNSVQNVNIHSGYCDMKDSNIGPDVVIQVYGIDQEDTIVVDTDPSATGSHVTYNVNRIISGNFVNNFVNGTIELGTIDSQEPHFTIVDLVRGMTIKDNIGLGTTPIVVHRSFSSQYDNYNIYTYQGNTGTMAMKTNGIDLVLIEDSDIAGMRQMYNQSGLYVYSPGTTGPCFEISLFTIGTKNVVTKVMTSTANSHGAGLGFVGGIVANLDSEAGPNKPMTKSGTSQFSWGIYNMPLAVGVAVMSYGDHQSFDFEQL